VGFNPPQIDTNQRVLYRHQRALWPRGASHFSCFAKKSNQKKATPIFALILRCSQRAGPAQIARWRAAARGGLMVRVYDRALLRSSGSNTRGPRSDRFLIASRCGLREPGCEHPGYGTAYGTNEYWLSGGPLRGTRF
jgi:hypothetical protein